MTILQCSLLWMPVIWSKQLPTRYCWHIHLWRKVHCISNSTRQKSSFKTIWQQRNFMELSAETCLKSKLHQCHWWVCYAQQQDCSGQPYIHLCAFSTKEPRWWSVPVSLIAFLHCGILYSCRHQIFLDQNQDLDLTKDDKMNFAQGYSKLETMARLWSCFLK